MVALVLVGGVASNRFDPTSTVHRAQMASFLARAKAERAAQPLPSGAAAFSDIDDTSTNLDRAEGPWSPVPSRSYLEDGCRRTGAATEGPVGGCAVGGLRARFRSGSVLRGAAVVVLGLTVLGGGLAQAQPGGMVRDAVLTLEHGESGLTSSAITPDGRYGYVGTYYYSMPDALIKIDLATMTRVGALPFGLDDGHFIRDVIRVDLRTLVVDHDARFAYVYRQDDEVPVRSLLRIDLDAMAIVEEVELDESIHVLYGLQAGLISPDGRTLYFAAQQGLLEVDVDTLEVGRLLPWEGCDRTIAIDPDGRYVYAGHGDTLLRIDLDSFEVDGSFRLSYLSDWFKDLVIAPDGTALYTVGNGQVARFDTGSLQRTGVVPIDGRGSRSATIAIDPTGQHVYAGWQDRIYHVDAVEMELVGSLTMGPGEVEARTSMLAPDGRYLYVGHFTLPGRVVRIDLDPPVPVVEFSDVPVNNVHAANIQRLLDAGITAGCAEGVFCPNDPVTRDQMATFLTRALELEASGPQPFADVPVGSTHDLSVRALVEAEITAGCAPERYCPRDVVTRAEMATLLTRALELETVGVQLFEDVPEGSTHDMSVRALVEAGITAGCAPDRYCPQDPVTRAQMASFLVRALGL